MDETEIIEGGWEALLEALELAKVTADVAIRNTKRLSQYMDSKPPKNREEWATRSQVADKDGQEVGWLSNQDARQIDLSDRSGRGDVGLTEEPGQKAPVLKELEGQFFVVTRPAGVGTPEELQPLNLQDAQALIREHRPDLSVRETPEGYLEFTTRSRLQAMADRASEFVSRFTGASADEDQAATETLEPVTEAPAAQQPAAENPDVGPAREENQPAPVPQQPEEPTATQEKPQTPAPAVGGPVTRAPWDTDPTAEREAPQRSAAEVFGSPAPSRAAAASAAPSAAEVTAAHTGARAPATATAAR